MEDGGEEPGGDMIDKRRLTFWASSTKNSPTGAIQRRLLISQCTDDGRLTSIWLCIYCSHLTRSLEDDRPAKINVLQA